MRGLNIAKGASPHCWRKTFSTLANENGHRPDAIEKQLPHVESNKVRATYKKAMLVDERRKIMQAWADYLSMAEAENVIPLHRRPPQLPPRDRPPPWLAARPQRLNHLRVTARLPPMRLDDPNPEPSGLILFDNSAPWAVPGASTS